MNIAIFVVKGLNGNLHYKDIVNESKEDFGMKCKADNFTKDCYNQENCCEECEIGYENCPESCCEFEKTGNCKECRFSVKENHNCKNCYFYDEDNSTGYKECNSEDITERQRYKHFTSNMPNCPHWKKRV